jgi:fatty acid desaturase
MNRKEIESLLIWLIAALLVSTIATPALVEYSKSILESGNSSAPFGMSTGEMVARTAYVILFAKLLVNLVIAFWVYKTTTSKKLLWVVFSLLAGWWALPVFIFYHYFAECGHNQSSQLDPTE